MSDSDTIPAKSRGSVDKGVLLGLVLHSLQVLVVPGVVFLFNVFYPSYKQPVIAGLFFAAYAWSITQLLYLGPATWLAFRRGKRETGKGLVIVAACGILLNGACDAFVFLRGR